MTRLYPAISMGKAAEVVGFVVAGASAEQRDAAAKKMRAYLHAKEKAAGCRFLVRRGGEKRRRYYVTMPQLRHHCPEFFSKRDEGVEILRAGIGMLEDKIAGLTRGLQLLNRRLEAIELRRVLRPLTDGYGQTSGKGETPGAGASGVSRRHVLGCGSLRPHLCSGACFRAGTWSRTGGAAAKAGGAEWLG